MLVRQTYVNNTSITGKRSGLARVASDESGYTERFRLQTEFGSNSTEKNSRRLLNVASGARNEAETPFVTDNRGEINVPKDFPTKRKQLSFVPAFRRLQCHIRGRVTRRCTGKSIFMIEKGLESVSAVLLRQTRCHSRDR